MSPSVGFPPGEVSFLLDGAVSVITRWEFSSAGSSFSSLGASHFYTVLSCSRLLAKSSLG